MRTRVVSLILAAMLALGISAAYAVGGGTTSDDGLGGQVIGFNTTLIAGVHGGMSTQLDNFGSNNNQVTLQGQTFTDESGVWPDPLPTNRLSQVLLLQGLDPDGTTVHTCATFTHGNGPGSIEVDYFSSPITLTAGYCSNSTQFRVTETSGYLWGSPTPTWHYYGRSTLWQAPDA